MNFRIRSERIRSWSAYLNKSYKPTNDKPMVKIAELAFILPALGLFYIWEYFSRFGIEYYDYFDLKDSLAVLYQNLMPVIYIGTMFSMFFTILLPDVLKRMNKGRTEAQTDEISENGFSNLTVILTVLLALFGFFILLKAHHLSLATIIILLVLAIFTGYFYLFVHKNIGYGFAIMLAFLYAEVRSGLDAKYTIEHKRTENIYLKQHSDSALLTEGDQCRYIIYKSSNYYFLRDDCKKMTYVYSITGTESTSFKSNK
ncbi:hypothetical protein [Chryseobacterium sp.]|uniref:hypothetical protein n=1 Tax=Chryseobacterium sp. TaxID=1871047 RepID=UPI003342AE63